MLYNLNYKYYKKMVHLINEMHRSKLWSGGYTLDVPINVHRIYAQFERICTNASLYGELFKSKSKLGFESLDKSSFNYELAFMIFDEVCCMLQNNSYEINNNSSYFNIVRLKQLYKWADKYRKRLIVGHSLPFKVNQWNEYMQW